MCVRKFGSVLGLYLIRMGSAVVFSSRRLESWRVMLVFLGRKRICGRFFHFFLLFFEVTTPLAEAVHYCKHLLVVDGILTLAVRKIARFLFYGQVPGFHEAVDYSSYGGA